MYNTRLQAHTQLLSNEDAVEFEQVHTSASYMWIRLRLWFYLYKLKPCLQIDYARQTSMGCSTRRSFPACGLQQLRYSTSYTICGITFTQFTTHFASPISSN